MNKRRTFTLFSMILLVVSVRPALADDSDGGQQSKKNHQLKGKTVGEVLNQIAREDRGHNLKMQSKSSTSLPATQKMQQEQVEHNLGSIKPPRTSDFYKDESADEVEIEKITDLQINKLYKLTQQFSHSKNRGELWLRLAELYSEKARLIEFKKQREYDKKLTAFEHNKKRGVKPKLNLADADEYNRRAVQLYEWFLKDFPNDEKVDQALFFLGYNFVQLNEMKKGVSFYQDLTRRFPNSPYVLESYFALGEYYFENENWAKANENYTQVIQRKSPRLYDFALYKSAWCLYRTGKSAQGLKLLETVIRRGRSQAESMQIEGRKEINRVRLAAEARRDLVPFFAESGQCENAEAYFLDLTGNQGEVDKMTEALAYNLSSAGSRECARLLFRRLIAKNPHAPKAFDYQFQIVQNYLNVEHTKAFQEEMFRWIALYGPNGTWAKDNASDKQLLENSYSIQESTLRNYVLQMHQTAQNSRVKGSQKEASEGYKVYLQSFPNSKQISQMHFFYGELLFDMGKYDEAASQYQWVEQNDSKGPYYEKAATNVLLALDKTLPDEKAVRDRLGSNTDPQPLDPSVARFEEAAKLFFQKHPKADKVVEVKFRLGRLYYAYGHFDEALELFRGITRDYPKTKYAEYSANLILDIYDLKKDYAGLAKAGNEILANPTLANSSVGQEVRSMVERVNFKKGQDLEGDKKYGDSAHSFEEFAKTNPRSPLALSAQYNAGVNYERAGDVGSAMRMYGLVMVAPVGGKDKAQVHKNEELKQKARKLEAGLTQQTGQYRKAGVLFERYANDFPHDKDAAAFHFNAAVIYDGLDMHEPAVRNYDQYYKTSSTPDRKESYFYTAEMYRRRGVRKLAIENYQKYLSLHPSDAQKTLDSTYQIAVLTEKSGPIDKAYPWYNRTVAVHKDLTAGGQTVKAGPAAEAKLKLALRHLEELKAIRIPHDPAQQQAAVKQKLALVNRLNTEMADVIRYDHGPTIVGALAATGQAYDHMNQSILAAPVPKGLSAEEMKQYQAGIEQIVAPFRAKAAENFRSAYTRGLQLEAYSPWLEVAHKGLQTYAPQELADKGEMALEVRTQDWMGL